MLAIDQPYALLLIFAALISAVLTISALRHHPSLVARSFSILIAAVTMWVCVSLFFFIFSNGSQHLFNTHVSANVNMAGQTTGINGNTQIDLAILDLVMPQVSGLQLLKSIETINPHVRTILCTGHVLDRQAINKISGRYQCLRKPYTIDELACAIQKVIHIQVDI